MVRIKKYLLNFSNGERREEDVTVLMLPPTSLFKFTMTLLNAGIESNKIRVISLVLVMDLE